MAEIRVRDASPELMKQLQQIALETKQATVTGVLTTMIPRYHAMKKRIDEQNSELAKLANELREAKYRLSTAKSELQYIQESIKQHLRETTARLASIKKQSDKFGTKKPSSAGRPGQPGKKKVPNKKAKRRNSINAA